MGSHAVAVVGAGSQGRVHATGYAALGERLVGVVDLDVSAAEGLAAELGIPYASGDVEGMLRATRPEVLSICTPAPSHLETVRLAVAAGVRAIHCEKPFALSYGEAVEMERIAREAGVALSVNLQRRFDPVFRFARERIDAGAIGDVTTIEGYCPNLADWGSHILDLILFYRGDARPEWVIGQIDVTVNRRVYGVPAETSSLTQAHWADGVSAYLATGRAPQTPALHRGLSLGVIVHGTEGRIEVDGSRCLVRRFGAADEVRTRADDTDPAGWDRGVDPAITAATRLALADLIAALDAGREPELTAARALAGAELVFGTYESSRSRRRVELPLDRDDNALFYGLEHGFWAPSGEQNASY
jgi:UDP-N-acetylglucosamine 3-dehydrogenase